MKKFISGFCLRGLVAGGFGPLVLTAVYGILHTCAGVETLTLGQFCTGIVSLYVLAFVAGGMNVIYQIEQLPLMVAILIHGGVLYAGYLATYLVNDWLAVGVVPMVVFSGVFVVGYLVIWCIVYTVNKRSTDRLNRKLQERQQK